MAVPRPPSGVLDLEQAFSSGSPSAQGAGHKLDPQMDSTQTTPDLPAMGITDEGQIKEAILRVDVGYTRNP